MKSKNILSLTILLTMFILTACQKNSYYHHSESIPSKGWDMNGTLFFQDSLRDDAPEKLHFTVELRHNNLYPYQNFWLYLRTRTSDGKNRLDSINWKLSEPSGRWIGEGWGSLYNLTHQLPDLEIHKTTGNRWFSIEVQHGLKDPTLTGIENIGIHLYTDK
jgi:gliding motility-associated lipoprotein GldH